MANAVSWISSKAGPGRFTAAKEFRITAACPSCSSRGVDDTNSTSGSRLPPVTTWGCRQVVTIVPAVKGFVLWAGLAWYGDLTVAVRTWLCDWEVLLETLYTFLHCTLEGKRI